MVAPYTGAAADSTETDQAASGRPIGVGPVTYADAGLQLLDHGYEPIPVIPGQKRPAPSRWSSVAVDETMVEEWSGRFPGHSVGLRTGCLVGVDLDILDPDLAHRLTALTTQRLGETLVRIGLHPKRLLLYRTEVPFPKLSCGKVEILGLGQQFVAFGRHPDTGRAYSWPGGETPLEVPIDQLPQVSRDDLAALLAEMEPLLPVHSGRRVGPRNGIEPEASIGPTRDACGLVVEGRDGWLSTLAFHAVHDALDTGETRAGPIADVVWRRFSETTDLTRPRQDGHRRYEVQDAQRKVGDKLRLAAGGNPNGAAALRRAGEGGVALREAVSRNADEFAKALAPVVEVLREEGHTTLRALANALNDRGMMTRRGGRWPCRT